LREREGLVGDATRLVNRIKGLLALHGIARFTVRSKMAAQRLRMLRTAEGELLPPNTLATLLRAVERLHQIQAQIAAIEAAQRHWLKQAPRVGPHPMILLLVKVRGVGNATKELLVREALSRNLRDRRAVTRYAGATGAPDESGSQRREKGLAKPAPGREQGAGNARVPHGSSPWAEGPRALLQLAWRFLRHRPDSALVRWFRQRTQDGRGTTKKTMIVTLARKLLVALLGVGDDRHGATGRPPARDDLRESKQTTVRRASPLPGAGVPMTIRGGGVPLPPMALVPLL
jgi:transposase